MNYAESKTPCAERVILILWDRNPSPTPSQSGTKSVSDKGWKVYRLHIGAVVRSYIVLYPSSVKNHRFLTASPPGEAFGRKPWVRRKPYEKPTAEAVGFSVCQKNCFFDRLAEVKEAPKTSKSNLSAYIGTVRFELRSKSKHLA